jgi:fatty aldehyde-generating acyl-ACP reductase
MDHQPASLKFAAIGHQDSWEKVLRFVNSIRDLKAIGKLSLEQVKDVYRFIPPRALFDVEMYSSTGSISKGVYIETFIPPDQLSPRFLHANLKKVKEACALAAQLNVPVVSLGGFTSIVLESAGSEMERMASTHFTTGNTLTAGFIVKNIEKACAYFDVDLKEAKLLVIGATGDIGSACVNYFSGKVNELLLCARQETFLKKQALLYGEANHIRWSTDVASLLPKADIIISVASSLVETYNWHLVKETAIVCDAGYPKNLAIHLPERHVFFGGLGQVSEGFYFTPDYQREIYQFPLHNIVHGCLLEAIVLSMENKPQSFSKGRGNITVAAMEAILQTAAAHGIYPSPLFNSLTIWNEEQKNTQHVNNHHQRTSAIV